MMRSALALLAALLAPLAAADYHAALAHWATVLDAYVDDSGRTDFVGLARDRAALDRFVAALAGDGPRTRPAAFDGTAAELAFHVNAYNALAMHGVIERGIPEDFDSFFKRAGFFRFRKVMVDGEETNLYDYENRVIRKLGDARVHFALNCMVRSCPRLPREPFEAATLDAAFDGATREFLADPRHLRVDHAGETLWLSAILDFYTEDFTDDGRQGLIAWVNRWRNEPVPAHYRVRFLDYDWTVNQAPR